MKHYDLKILYPSSNKWGNEQSFEKTVQATDVVINNGCYQFFDGPELKASYPVGLTIILRIE